MIDNERDMPGSEGEVARDPNGRPRFIRHDLEKSFLNLPPGVSVGPNGFRLRRREDTIVSPSEDQPNSRQRILRQG